jgi:acyl-coenzyme A thioesterase PaaI-like protein
MGATVTDTHMTLEALQAALAEHFAPWVQALNLQVEDACASQVRLRLPVTPQLTRVGDMLCGQAMMAAADTAMVLALMHHLGEFRPMTTVQLGGQFMRPLAGQDALVLATVLRAGKSLAFGDIDITGANDGKSVYRAQTTYALI